MIAVFWVDRYGVRQMEAGWRNVRGAQMFIAIEKARGNVRPDTIVLRWYAGMCPW